MSASTELQTGKGKPHQENVQNLEGIGYRPVVTGSRTNEGEDAREETA